MPDYCYDRPVISYDAIYTKKYILSGTSIVEQNVTTLPDGTITINASFVKPSNKIYITMTPLSYIVNYIVRVTPSDSSYSTELGTIIYQHANFTINQAFTFTLDVNETNFNEGNINYRISLYAQASDGTWDVTELFLTLDGGTFVPLSNESGIEVYQNNQ